MLQHTKVEGECQDKKKYVDLFLVDVNRTNFTWCINIFLATVGLIFIIVGGQCWKSRNDCNDYLMNNLW